MAGKKEFHDVFKTILFRVNWITIFNLFSVAKKRQQYMEMYSIKYITQMI